MQCLMVTVTMETSLVQSFAITKEGDLALEAHSLHVIMGKRHKGRCLACDH